MKGKREFTQAYVDAIRSLIRQKMKADASEQKSIRRKIRNLGFYYSDFCSDKGGYTVEDFDRLLKSGQIWIVGAKQGNNQTATNSATSVTAKPAVSAPIKSPGTNSPVSRPNISIDEIPGILNHIRSNRFDPGCDSHTGVPDCPGVYVICLKRNAKLPDTSVIPMFSEFDGLKVVYTGIASKSLQKRDCRQHFTGDNAGRSTLRKSLGVLFSYNLVPRDKNPETGKTKFSEKDELALTEWMCNNLVMYFMPTSSYVETEFELIRHFDPPLNLKDSTYGKNTLFREMLSQLRRTK